MNDQPTLKRSINLPLLTLYGLGTILGAGIYVLVGEVAGVSGMHAPAAFVVAAVLAGFSAFSYAELSARYPRSAGEAVYVREGLQLHWLAVVVGILVTLSGLVSAATITRGFVGYLHVFVDIPTGLAIAVTLTTLGMLAVWGISQSVGAAAMVTVLEVVGLVTVVWVGREAFLELPTRAPELLPPLSAEVWQGIALGAFLAFYAYIGFEDMVNVAEEVRNPRQTLPIGIVLALALATVLYLGVALIAVLTLRPQELAGQEAPLALIYQRATGADPVVISLISLVAVINGALVQIIMASRILYGMASQGWIPRAFGRINRVTRTPVAATVLVTAVSLGLALWLPLVTLAKFASFSILLVFALINLALVRVKQREPDPVGVRTYPIWVPVLGFLSSGGFLLGQLVLLVG